MTDLHEPDPFADMAPRRAPAGATAYDASDFLRALPTTIDRHALNGGSRQRRTVRDGYDPLAARYAAWRGLIPHYLTE